MSALLMGATVCAPVMAAEESGEPIAAVQEEAEDEKQPESEKMVSQMSHRKMPIKLQLRGTRRNWLLCRYLIRM